MFVYVCVCVCVPVYVCVCHAVRGVTSRSDKGNVARGKQSRTDTTGMLICYIIPLDKVSPCSF